jgi:hypothetical protein
MPQQRNYAICYDIVENCGSPIFVEIEHSGSVCGYRPNYSRLDSALRHCHFRN